MKNWLLPAIPIVSLNNHTLVLEAGEIPPFLFSVATTREIFIRMFLTKINVDCRRFIMKYTTPKRLKQRENIHLNRDFRSYPQPIYMV